MRQLSAVETTENMQQLAKELRDGGVLRQLADMLGSPPPAGMSAGSSGRQLSGGRQLSIEVPLPPDEVVE